MEIKDLTPNPNNPRKITDKKLKALKKTLEEFGDLGGFVYNRRSLQLVGGHQRQRVFDQTADIVLEVEHKEPTRTGTVAEGYVILKGERFSYREVDWDEPREKAANIAANKGAGEWDPVKLGDWFKGLDEIKFDLDLTMFDEDERAPFLKAAETGTEGLTDPDEIPEQVDTRCKLGDLWLLGEHRLLCGDSTDVLQVERLMGGEKADMVFTDPPYGYRYQSNHQSKHKMLENDDKILDFLPVAYASMENNSCIYVCGSHQTIDIWKPLFQSNFEYKNLIVWKKNNWSMGDLKGSFAGQHELILFGHKGKVSLEGKRDTDVWEFNREPPKDHPTQKPVDLISFAISKVLSNRILDLFLGSGSTLIACEKTGRKCYGMEIDPHYCDVILTRWEKFTGKTALLAGLV